MDEEVHYPTRPVDKDKAEQELVVNIKKATSPEETAPKQKHVRSAFPMYDAKCSNQLCRMHCIYLGLSFVYIILERTAGAADIGG